MVKCFLKEAYLRWGLCKYSFLVCLLVSVSVLTTAFSAGSCIHGVNGVIFRICTSVRAKARLCKSQIVFVEAEPILFVQCVTDS